MVGNFFGGIFGIWKFWVAIKNVLNTAITAVASIETYIRG